MNTRGQIRQMFAPARAAIIGIVFIIISVVLPVDFATAQGMTNNNASNLSGSVLINIYEEYGKSGFSEYELSFPDGVKQRTSKSKNGVFINEPEKLPMMSSDTFSSFYTAKKWNKIISKKVAFNIDADKESIFDTAWSPNGLYIAVLSVTWRYSYNPIYLLFTISGHPTIYRTYYLRIYSSDGILVYKSRDADIGTFNAGRGSGWGAVVWINKDNASRTK